MKKIISIILAALMIFSTFGVFAEGTPEKMYIFVAPNAEGGDGSKDKPFGSFEEARDKIRAIKEKGQYPEGGVVVYFREGTYQVNEGIKLNGKQDSGTETGPVVYRSYMEEQVTFVGGVKLNISDFNIITDDKTLKRLNSEASGSVMVANLYDHGIKDLGKLNYFGAAVTYMTDSLTGLAKNGINIPTEQPPEIFFDDKQGILARYPNDEFSLTGDIIDTGDILIKWSGNRRNYSDFVDESARTYPPKPSIFKVSDDVKERMKNWAYEDEIWVYGFFQHNWADVSLEVDKVDIANGIITTKLPSPMEICKDKRYYVYNLLAELDSPGEYFIDRKTGDMYIYPVDKNGTVLFSSLKEPLITMEEVDYVDLKALSFQGTLDSGIVVNDSSNVNIELCSVSKAADRGIFTRNVTDTKVTSCRIYQVGNGGIWFSSGAGPRNDVIVDCVENLKSVGNVIENNEVSDFSRIVATYSPAITPMGVGTVIKHNKVHGGTHMAGYFGGSETLWEYNEFYDVLTTSEDAGCLYGGYGKESRGVKVRNNYFHDIGSTTNQNIKISIIYPDDTKDDITCEQNVFENINGVIFYSNGGRLHTVKNNIVINADTFTHFISYNDSDINGKYSIGQYNFLKYVGNPAYDKYPHFNDMTSDIRTYLPTKYNTVKNNVLIGVTKEDTSDPFLSENYIEPSLKLPSGTDPGFMNMQNRNYILRDDSAIYDQFPDFVAPDFKNMGMYTSMLEILMGDDTLAFYNGSPKAYQGFECEAITDSHVGAPYVSENEVYLPVRYVAEALGASVGYDDATAEVSITLNDVVTVIKPSDYVSRNSTTMLSASKLSQILGTTVKAFENGVTLVGNDIKITDDEDNLKYVQELARRLDNE